MDAITLSWRYYYLLNVHHVHIVDGLNIIDSFVSRLMSFSLKFGAHYMNKLSTVSSYFPKDCYKCSVVPYCETNHHLLTSAALPLLILATYWWWVAINLFKLWIHTYACAMLVCMEGFIDEKRALKLFLKLKMGGGGCLVALLERAFKPLKTLL